MNIKENLNIYLHDHMAGATGALELLGHLVSVAPSLSQQVQLSKLKDSIETDYDVLVEMAEHLGIEENGLKKAVAWMGEKIARLKLSFANDGSALGMFQSLEVLALGITGKRALWEALKATTPLCLSNFPFDFEDLKLRSDAQLQVVETMRIAAAREAFQEPEPAELSAVK